MNLDKKDVYVHTRKVSECIMLLAASDGQDRFWNTVGSLCNHA